MVVPGPDRLAVYDWIRNLTGSTNPERRKTHADNSTFPI